MYIFYDIIYLFFLLFYFLPRFLIKKKYHTKLSQRIGFFSPLIVKKINHSNVLWIHAVSVGEAMLACQLEERLYPFMGDNFRIVISTTTSTGQKIAKSKSRKDTIIFYFPLDISFVVRRTLNLINPQLIILMETELWPNLITQAHRKDIPVIMVNGRISDSSYWGYQIIKPVFKNIFKYMKLFCMQSQFSAKRIINLGASKNKVKICGNMKFDKIDKTLPPSKINMVKNWMDYKKGDKIFVCGSTHPGEEKIILDVYRDLIQQGFNLKLVIVPRHVKRRKEIERLLKKKRYNYSFFSNLLFNNEKQKVIFVMDKMGWLKALYSISTLTFIGGSLKDYGGHNIIEPSLYFKPVIFGPYMSNFRVISSQFLKNDAAIQVNNKQQLFNSCRKLLREKTFREKLGRNAYKVVEDNQGSIDRIIEYIMPIITKNLNNEN